MSHITVAAIVYSCQILLIIGAAAAGEMLLEGSRASARLAYWRAVGVLCLALPFFPTSAQNAPAMAVTFNVLPLERVVTSSAAAQVPHAIGRVIPLVWAAGAALGLASLLTGAWRIRWLRQHSVAASVGSDINALRAAIAPAAEFRWSDDLPQPVTFGVRRPRILLPRRFNDLGDEARRAVACHELLHVRRRDWVWTLIEAQIRAVFWFHPGVWWLVDRFQLLREQLVDDLVVNRTASRREYMLSMLMFAEGARPTGLSSAFLRRHHLRSRIRELVKESHMSFRRVAVTMMVLALVMGGVTVATVRALPLGPLSAMAQVGAASRLEIRLAENAAAAGLREAVVSGSDQRIYLYPTALATWADVVLARITGPGNPTSVAVTFNSAAAARMASATAAHIGKPIAIILDGRVVAAPILRDAVSSSAVITGITPASAQELIDANLSCRTNPAQCAAAVLPSPIHQEKAQYTPAAMGEHIEGRVLLEAVVLPDGSTGDVTIVKSLDSTYGLDQQAIDALKQWTWKPGTRNGEPSRVAVQVEMTFTLR